MKVSETNCIVKLTTGIAESGVYDAFTLQGHCNDSVAFCLVLDVPKVNTTVRGCELPGTCTAVSWADYLFVI